MPKARVLCNRCLGIGVLSGKYDLAGVTAAWEPEFLPPEGAETILACPPWPPPRYVPGAEVWKCMDCGIHVSVSPSSKWLLR